MANIITDGDAKFVIRKIGGEFEKWCHCRFFWLFSEWVSYR